ncbi:unnamed protein product [Rhizophagus irregularis]|nr:unnamed protein product [Rhizophagus irregularis]
MVYRKLTVLWILDLVSVSSALGYGTGSFGIGLRTLTSWTSLVGFLNIEQHLAVGQRLGVFSLRTISVFGPSEPKELPER